MPPNPKEYQKRHDASCIVAFSCFKCSFIYALYNISQQPQYWLLLLLKKK